MLSKLKQLLGIAPAVDYKTLIQQGATIVDVRTAGEFAAGHVKGSINIPVDQLAKSSTQLKNKNQDIINCCASGMRSASAKSYLKSAGYQQVYNAGSWYSLKNKI